MNAGPAVGVGLVALSALDEGLRWSTSSFGHSTDTSPLELCALGEHLKQCQAGGRRWRAWQRGSQAVHGFMAARFVSSLTAAAVLGGGVWLWL